MQRPNILIVDDDPDILDSLGQALGTKYTCYFASNAREAMALLRSLTPSLMLIDIYMPGEDGVSLCKSVRDGKLTQDIPIIMMTAMDATETRVRVFESGADDYMAKPFHLDELYSRIASKLRRLKESRVLPPTVVNFGNIGLDPINLRAFVAGEEIELGMVEFRLLNALATHSGELVQRDDLSLAIWGDDQPVTRALDTHVGSLRGKLARSSVSVKTVYGKGFVLVQRKGD